MPYQLSEDWVRPPHVPAEPLSDAELGIQKQIDQERRFYDRVNCGRAARWRIDNPDGFHDAEIISKSPTGGCYVPSVNAFPRTEAQRSREAMLEIMDPESAIGLYTRGGGGFDGLFRNVLRTMLKRKLKREGMMSRGTWLGQGDGELTKRGKLRKRRPAKSVWAAVFAVFILILLSSPPWPGTP